MSEMITYQQPAPALPATDTWLPVVEQVGDLAARLAGTNFVPKPLRGKPAEVAAAILTGRELGLPPMRALAEIHVIDGRPSLSANAMRALILAAGHHITVDGWTDTSCTLSGYRRGEDEPAATVTYTIGDAQRAGLSQRGPWKAHPRSMLLARATSDLAKAVFPDVVGGLELADDLTPDGGGKPARTAVRRQSATRPSEPTDTGGVSEPTGTDVEAAHTPSESPQQAPEPDSTPAETVDGEEEPPITSRQMRQMQAILKQRGITDPQQQRDGMSRIIGRTIKTRKELTASEAQQILEQLNDS